MFHIRQNPDALDLTPSGGVEYEVAVYEARRLALLLNTPVIVRHSFATCRISKKGEQEPN